MNVILFWSKPLEEGDTFEKWRSREITTTVFHELGLESHQKFGSNVKLYTYQNLITEVPECVQISDADDIYSAEEAFESLSKGHSIAHISDVVRLESALTCNGLVLDMDGVVINKLPDEIPCFTCTMPAKQSGGMAIKWGKSHPPFVIHDDSWDGKALSAFPIRVHEDIKTEVTDLINKIKTILSDDPSKNTKGWNFIMWILKDIANNNPKVKVLPPIKCCPLPAWKRAGNCYSLDYPTKLDGNNSLFGYELPSIEKMFNESYIIQHFFESSFKNSPETVIGFWETVHENSLLGQEMKRIFGNKYSKELDEW